MTLSKTPIITDAMIDWLDELWPDRMPDPSDDPLLIQRKIGEVNVVRRVKRERDKQMKRLRKD